MSDVFEGTYHDGRQAGSEAVHIRVDDEGLAILAQSGTQRAFWRFKDLLRHPDDAEGHVRLGLARGSEARLIVHDPSFPDVLRAKAPYLFHRRGLAGTLRLALGLGALSAALIAAVYFGMPRFAEALAPLVPPRVEAQIGERYHQALTRHWPPCTLEGPAKAALEDLVKRLMDEPELPVTVGIIQMYGIENAFALPGGHVVFTKRLIQRMESPDELAGVLAHELGHVVERHAMIAVIEDTGMNVLLAVLTGGSSGSGEWAINTAGTLASLSYSRRLENRADERGIAMLEGAGVSTAGIATLFERWEKEDAEDNDDALFTLPPFLSTHPANPERIKKARDAAKAQTKPALSKEAWTAVKAVCEAKKDESADTPKETGTGR